MQNKTTIFEGLSACIFLESYHVCMHRLEIKMLTDLGGVLRTPGSIPNTKKKTKEGMECQKENKYQVTRQLLMKCTLATSDRVSDLDRRA